MLTLGQVSAGTFTFDILCICDLFYHPTIEIFTISLQG